MNTDHSDRLFNVAYALGVDFPDDGRAFVPLDIDGDGDLDLPVLSLQGLRLMENTLPTEGRHFARIRLTATNSHPLALGANVVVQDGDVRQQDYVKVTAGFQSQVAPDLHFGIRAPKDDRIDVVEIKWPSGAVERHVGVPMDRLIRITEGQAPRSEPLPRWPDDAKPIITGQYDLSATAAVVGGGEAQAIAPLGKPVVVNFWAPWCKPCNAELPVLRKVSDRLGDAARFVGLSVETKDMASVKASVAEHRLGYRQLYASPAILESFFGGDGDAPLPSTFVFDAQGKLRRAFRRAVEPRDLLGLLDALGEEPAHPGHLLVLGEAALKRNQIQRAVAYFNRALEVDPRSSFVLAQLGVAHANGGKTDEGIAYLERALKVDPRFPYAWHHLGLVRERREEYAAAQVAFQKAADLKPDERRYLISLATAHRRAGANEKSAQILERLLELDPADATGWLNLGKARLALERADSLAALEKVLELDPENAEARELMPLARTHQ